MWYKFGHVTPTILGERNLRSPPCGSVPRRASQSSRRNSYTITRHSRGRHHHDRLARLIPTRPPCIKHESARDRALRDWYLIAEQPAPALHLARPEGRAAPRIVLVTVTRISRSCEHFQDGFDLHLLPCAEILWRRHGPVADAFSLLH